MENARLTLPSDLWELCNDVGWDPLHAVGAGEGAGGDYADSAYFNRQTLIHLVNKNRGTAWPGARAVACDPEAGGPARAPIDPRAGPSLISDMDAKLRVDIRKWVEGRVINNHRWSERLYSLQIEAPIEDVQAGQFGRLGLVIDEELVGRPYSFVKRPG